MAPRLPPFLALSPEVAEAIEQGKPVVALESTVITHGLPYPENLTLARDMEDRVHAQGSLPATIGVVAGRVRIGMSDAELQRLATEKDVRKISLRDIAPAVAQGANGGTTVAGTMWAAQRAGLRVFATGGIGGVHHDVSKRRRGNYDVSTDLEALARIPMIVVCAGAKAILNLTATLERLETLGVPVIGYQTDEFPAFYSRSSGLKTSSVAHSPGEIAAIARTHWELGMSSALLVTVPPPVEDALPSEMIKQVISEALNAAREQEISGQAVTPFLLQQVKELTGGASLRANLGLLLNNARVAGQVARHLAIGQTPQRREHEIQV